MSAADNQLLYDAIGKGDVNGVRNAIANGADVNSAVLLTGPGSGVDDAWDLSQLMAACGNRENFSLPIVKLLLDNGAKVNKRSALWDQTPLMVLGSAGNGSEQALNLLLDAGADINAADDRKGKTFLMCAAPYLTPEVLELAVRRGAGINQRDKDGRTLLLHMASRGCDPEGRNPFNSGLVKSFVRCGADFKVQDDNGWGVAKFMDYRTSQLLFIEFYECGDEEMTQYFYDIADANTKNAKPGHTLERDMFTLVRLALMFPETNEELEKGMRKKRSAAFQELLLYASDASVSFWSNVLNVVSEGRRSTMRIRRPLLVHRMVKILTSVLDRSPDTAINFISKRLGADVLKEWEKGGVEGAGILNERLSTILRELVDDGAVSFDAGYVL